MNISNDTLRHIEFHENQSEDIFPVQCYISILVNQTTTCAEIT